MNTTTNPFTTEYRGGALGTRFVDCPPSGDLASSTINKMIIRHDPSCVFHLQVYYSWNHGTAIHHGTHGSGGAEINLSDNEFITAIEGSTAGDWIRRIIFVTTKDRYGPFGGANGESFKWGSPAGSTRLLAFSGNADQYLRGLQATFGEPLQRSPKTTRYESLSIRDTPTLDPGAGIGDSAAHSKFSRHLMSPVATLSVGPKPVQFHAHEDTLCTLPFFQAALQGLFKEASEKAISMPEDDPSNVSALIEFLYTGNYTYTYDPTSITLSEGSTTPVGDLAEGLYHLGVYVVASKYDSSVLSEMAVKNFQAVAIELDNINALRLWKAAYAQDLCLSRCRKDFKNYSSGEGLVSWVKGLFREHEEEINETFAACPQLATDLLRIATSDE